MKTASRSLYAAIVLIALLLNIPVSHAAQEITLEDAISIARAHNPDLAAAAQEINVARGELEQANYLSQSDFESDNAANYRARSNRSNTQDWRVGMRQEFEVFGQRSLRQKSRTVRLQQSAAEFEDGFRLLIATVRLTFLDALRARQLVRLLTEVEALDARLLEAARIRLSAGEIGQIDHNLAVVRYGQSQRALIQGQEIYRLQRSSLGRLLGGYAGPEPDPTGDFNPPKLAIDLETLVANAKSRRPDLRARQLEVARLNAEYALNQRMNLPNPSFGVFLGHELNTERFVGGTLGLSIPLFNRRTGEATVIEARRRQASARERAKYLDIEREVRDAYYGYLAAYRQLQIYQHDVVVPARESFNLLERAFKEGKIDLLRLSVAERLTFEARTAYLDAGFGVWSSQIALELATGAPL
ncbi:MAG: TolC family protein [Candidatus Binatus sp.]|uniref:TolC family protein n=1 Tax=Candidatus Binatus sp. TaxID=2811406 RepID=UPI00271D40AE|nr:TolC family protein [Candidatus Binatus sp.]MDO8431429.1 TolC family protein [Candidatus Binatus sp.]